VPSFSVVDWSWKALCDAVPYLRTESPILLVLTLLLDHGEKYMNIPMVGISPKSPLRSRARKISQCALLCAVDCGGQLKQM